MTERDPNGLDSSDSGLAEKSPRDSNTAGRTPLKSQVQRVLVDTSVLAPEPLWLWMRVLTELVPAANRPQLLVTPDVIRELRPALRRVDSHLTRAQVDTAARLRTDSLTRVRPHTPNSAGTRPHVLDPDDAHLDNAAVSLGVDVLVTDDVHAFAPVHTEVRGYALLTADEFLCALTDTLDLSVAEALDRYVARLTQVVQEVGGKYPVGSPSHRLRRSRARRFAKRVVRVSR